LENRPVGDRRVGAPYRPQLEESAMSTQRISKAIRGNAGVLYGLAATILFVLALFSLSSRIPSLAAESAKVIPAPAAETLPGDGLQTVVLAGGCFWGVQAVFQHVEGVHQAVSGYAGGTKTDPTYEQVSSGQTGHAESVQVTFDPHKISYGKILQIFFSVAHDPTQLDRQGPDVGTQYRSAIFFSNEAEKRVAQSYVAQLGGAATFSRPIATRIDPLTKFYPAEAYHQNYALTHPNQPYIVYNDLPKVENLKRLFGGAYREQPVTVATATMHRGP
jgi:peptide-methionine (S)-S-oxide reductase